jgi:hypothetical protein
MKYKPDVTSYKKEMYVMVKIYVYWRKISLKRSVKEVLKNEYLPYLTL